MKPGIAIVLFAVLMTVFSILYLGPEPLPARQIALLFVFWLLVSGGLVAAFRWFKGRSNSKPRQRKPAKRKAGSDRR